MQHQPIGHRQVHLTHVPSHPNFLFNPSDLENPELAFLLSSSMLPIHPYPVYGGERPSPDLQTSPAAEWKDTPRTLYKNSPETEFGDNDILSDADGEGEEDACSNDPVRRVPLFGTGPHDESHSKENTSTFQALARQLPTHIRTTSSLFPDVSLGVNPVSSTLFYHAPATQATPAPADVTATAVPTTTSSIPRKRSLHLTSQPINPYQRSSVVQSAPVVPYPAPVINRSYLRRFRNAAPPQPTVSPKDLLVPHAEFRFGYDPEKLVIELQSPNAQDLESVTDEVEQHQGGLFFDVPLDEPVPEAVQPTEEAPVEENDGWDAQDIADDAAWTPEDAGEAPYEPPAKRRKTQHSDTPVTADTQPPAASSRPRRVQHEAAKTRKRHLQPNLVRTNGCMYGCTLLFSTAYEARRHQEDTHGREEAYAFIKAAAADPREPVYAKDYRFLGQIAVHAMGDKMDSRVRSQLDEALEQEDGELDAHAVDVIAKFARDWTKRYECPRCGASFSRLDSKKRHFEKQCR